MTCDGPRAEAVKLEKLASDDLKQQTGSSAQALLNEVFAIPPDEIHKVQAELKAIGSVSDPHNPEVFIDTRETQRTDMVNGRSKITIGEAAKGVVLSGVHYTSSWNWSTEGNTRYLYPQQAPKSNPGATELFPAWMQLPTTNDLSRSFIRQLIGSFW